VTFTWPIALLALLAVPLLVGLYVAEERRRRDSAARFGNPALLPNVVDRAPGRLRHMPLAVLLVALAAMIVGVARPRANVSVRREEATVIVAMDVSRSMAATDVSPTRLDAARSAAKAFVAQIPHKFRVGVVSFGTRAVVGVPPTLDRSLVDASLDTLHPGDGTAIGDGVALSVDLGQQARTSDGTLPPRAVVLISDGAREGGRISPDAAAALARARHVPVYAVLVGTENGVVHQRLTGGYQQIIRVPASPGTLQRVAKVSGGQFYAAPDLDRLRQVYGDLGSRLGTRTESREITDWFAAGAAALLLVGGALSAFLFKRVP
jgi:Ca-activated chloride channel family protein